MADEPSNAELAWRLERLQATADGLVGRPEYVADKSALERRMDAHERQMTETRENGFKRIREVEQRVETRAKEVDTRFEKHEEAHQSAGLHWRTLLWTGVLPAAAAIAAVFLTYWLSHH